MTLSNNGPLDAGDYTEPLDELEAHLNELLAQDLDDTSAGKLNDVVKEIQTLTKSADKSRVAIKEPHLTAGRKVDEEFKPVIERGKTLASKGKDKATAYMIEQRRIAEEARRKAEEEAAEKARIAEQLRQDALIGESVQADAEEAERLVLVATAEADNAGRVGSVSGGSRTMSLRTSYKAELSDAKSAAIHFADHPKVQDAILSAADALLRGADRPDSIPGINIQKIEKAA